MAACGITDSESAKRLHRQGLIVFLPFQQQKLLKFLLTRHTGDFFYSSERKIIALESLYREHLEQMPVRKDRDTAPTQGFVNETSLRIVP